MHACITLKKEIQEIGQLYGDPLLQDNGIEKQKRFQLPYASTLWKSDTISICDSCLVYFIQLDDMHIKESYQNNSLQNHLGVCQPHPHLLKL